VITRLGVEQLVMQVQNQIVVASLMQLVGIARAVLKEYHFVTLSFQVAIDLLEVILYEVVVVLLAMGKLVQLSHDSCLGACNGKVVEMIIMGAY